MTKSKKNIKNQNEQLEIKPYYKTKTRKTIEKHKIDVESPIS